MREVHRASRREKEIYTCMQVDPALLLAASAPLVSLMACMARSSGSPEDWGESVTEHEFGGDGGMSPFSHREKCDR